MITNNLKIKGNALYVGGVSAVSLAEKYGTPLYVMDENLLRENMRRFKNSIDDCYDGNGCVYYASKAFSCKEIYRVANAEGIGADVVSGGELATALAAGFPPGKLMFHGNNKTDFELEYAVKSGVGFIVADNFPELERLNKIAENLNVKVNILFRVKPGIDAHTHEFIQTGQIDSKFGFSLCDFACRPKGEIIDGEAFQAIENALKYPRLEYKGLHCHIGSQIMDTAPFELAAERLFELAETIKKAFGKETEVLNLGGGFGIKYTENDDFVPYETYIKNCSVVVKKLCAEKGLAVPFIAIEPGRAIAGPAGVTLYTVGAVKEIPNVRTYISIDGGMTDNPRYALYGSVYEILCANKAAEEKSRIVTLAGSRCESGDLIGKDMPLQNVQTGDIIAVLATGAYNYSMASNYNRVPRPPVVFLKDGESRIVVNRETFEDVMRNDL